MNLHRAIIVTTDKKTLGWKSLPPKLQAITSALNSMKNADFTLVIEYRDYVPQVVSGRITRESFDSISLPYLKAGYDFVLVHISKAQSVQFAIQSTIRGIAQNDADEVAEGYFWADEGTKRGKYNQFVETCLHEISHLFCYGAKRLDKTHTYHDANGTIVGLFKKYNMAEYQPERFALKTKVSVLNAVFARLKAALALKPGLLPAVALAADRVVAEMALLGHPVRVTEGYRSIERQEALYAQGRTRPGLVVTNARGGESFHNYGVAVDMVFRKEGYNASEALWQTLGTIGKKHGFEWGGDKDWIKAGFIDRPHFQMTLGYKISDFQKNKVDYSRFR